MVSINTGLKPGVNENLTKSTQNRFNGFLSHFSAASASAKIGNKIGTI